MTVLHLVRKRPSLACCDVRPNPFSKFWADSASFVLFDDGTLRYSVEITSVNGISCLLAEKTYVPYLCCVAASCATFIFNETNFISFFYHRFLFLFRLSLSVLFVYLVGATEDIVSLYRT